MTGTARLGQDVVAATAAVWIWAMDRAGAPGAAARVAFAAALLFQRSGRVGDWTARRVTPRG